MGVLSRRGHPGRMAMTHAERERDVQRRAIRWVGTSVITWPIWAMTGATTGLPRVVVQTPHHVVATLGIWPLYFMVGGLVDVARRARRTYVDATPLPDEDDT